MPRHPIWVRTDGTISIGCEHHSLDHWLSNYREIGREAWYSTEDIEWYGNQLKQIASERELSHPRHLTYPIRALYSTVVSFITRRFKR
jgi:hypothetical protein